MAKRPRVADQPTRRTVLAGLAALPVMARMQSALASPQSALASPQSALASPQSALASRIYVSCADDRARTHYVVGFALDGRAAFTLPLPARGHGFAVHPARAEAIVFGRRPGAFAAVLDPRAGTLSAMIDPPRARCFYGHGTFSASGDLLYACEHDDATGKGFIGIYDARRGYARLDEFGAGGIGPHEVRLMPDGKTLVVAVGGILTDQDRDKLNIDTMDPSLAYIDAASGRLLEQVRPPADWHQLSIRHIDVDAAGRVAIAMQYEGDAGDAVPLAALHARGRPLQFLRAPEEDELRLKHYLGDIAFSADGRTIAASSPVGSTVALWDAASGESLAMTDAADGCGIVARADGFVITGGDGRIRRVDAGGNEPLAATTWLWDNHVAAVG